MAKSTQGDRSETGNEARAARGAKAAVDAGSAVAAGLQDIAQAWVDYAQQVMNRTTEATESLLKCQSFNDMLAVQAELMRGHLQAFLDQSTKLAEITNRMAVHSIDTIGEAAKQKGVDKKRR
jgi:hypothetical protein